MRREGSPKCKRSVLATAVVAAIVALACGQAPHSAAQSEHHHAAHSLASNHGAAAQHSTNTHSITVFNGSIGTFPYAPWWGWGSPPYPMMLPPVVIPAETMFGPAAVSRMLDAGMPRSGYGVGVINIIPRGIGGAAAPANAPNQAAPLNNAIATGKAQRYISQGDAAMRDQKYVEANQRYRRAAAAAPGLFEAYSRRGQALIALGRYDDAVRCFKQGVAANPLLPDKRTVLNDVYGPNQVAKTAHLEALAQQATAKPDDADLLFLVGIELFLDGQVERSRKFFQRAGQMTLGSHIHLLPFLKESAKHAPQVQKRAPAADGQAAEL